MEINIIHNAREHAAALARIGALMETCPEEGTPEADEIALLALVIEQYEEGRFLQESFYDFDAIEFILYVMEERGLSRKDMEAYIGGSGRVSEVLSRRRPLTLAMIRRLHDGLGIPADILIRPPRPAVQTEKRASRRPAARNSKIHAASAHA